jgi:hypothetical protein
MEAGYDIFSEDLAERVEQGPLFGLQAADVGEDALERLLDGDHLVHAEIEA